MGTAMFLESLPPTLSPPPPLLIIIRVAKGTMAENLAYLFKKSDRAGIRDVGAGIFAGMSFLIALLKNENRCSTSFSLPWTCFKFWEQQKTTIFETICIKYGIVG